MKMENKKDLNVIILGDNRVGKSSILQIIKQGESIENNNSSINKNNFIIKKKYERKRIEILLHFKDVENQITPQYIRDSHIVLLVFCDIKSLDYLRNSLHIYYKNNSNIFNPRFILVGNKCDTFGNDKDEIMKKGQEFAEEINAQFLTCSTTSLDNKDNIERYITTEAKNYIDEEEKNKNYINNERTGSITLNQQNHTKKFKCNC